MINTATEGYVKARIPRGLLGEIEITVVPTGKTRTEGGRVEAEFVCLTPKTNIEKIWLSKKDLVNPTESSKPKEGTQMDLKF